MTQDRESPTAPGEGEAPAREAEALRIRVRELTTRLERMRLERDESRNLLAQLRHGVPPPAAAPAPTSVAQIPPGKVLVNQEELEDLRRAKRDLVRLLAYGFLENFGFRQYLSFIKVKALAEALWRRREWGRMERRGFGAPGSGDKA